ncbi:MAG TPA: glycosyltransferase family 39 protein [Thermoanaerobaculia bacterium]|nr:glycosyltransferase family 39 protein [Thermoanaerobaculia bacterium]
MNHLSRLAGAAWWAAPAAAGTALRLYNLPAQVLGGDELHGVRVALESTLGQALTTFHVTDNCRPLTAIYRFLLDRGVGLTETIVRLPALFCGLLALLVIPWLVERRCGRPAGSVMAWLVALSPLLVFYSRIARPYAPVVLFSFGAAMAFESWWRTRRPGLAVAYCLLAGLSAYFHPLSMPLVLAPLVFGLGSLALERGQPAAARPGWGALAAVAAGAGLALAAVFLPGWSSLQGLMANKRQPLEMDPRTIAGVFELQGGSAHPLAAVLFWAAAGGGLVCLLRSDRRLGIYTAALVACQVGGLLVLSPEMMIHPLVFDRYLMPVQPWVLVWVAVGLGALWQPWRSASSGKARWRPLAGRAAAIAGLAAWALTGPLADPALARSSFTGHNDFIGFFCPRAHLPLAQVPVFYRTVLAREHEHDAPVLEYPWFPWWAYTQAFYVYQDVHRQDVLVASVRPIARQRQLDFRNMPPEASPEGFLASRARYLAVHLDLVAEQARITPHCWSALAGAPGEPGDVIPLVRRALQGGGRRMAGALAALWGPPDYEEPGLLVWDLERIRRGAGPKPGKAGETSPPS